MSGIRDSLTPEQRAIPMDLIIDPGFVHHRKIDAILGRPGIDFINDAIAKLPDMPDWEKKVKIDHIYSEAVLIFCKTIGIKTLQEVYSKQKGHIFCSVEKLAASQYIHAEERAMNLWMSPDETEIQVEFHYSTMHIYSDTLRWRLREGNQEFAIVAQLYAKDNDKVIFEPLLMGFPWLRKRNKEPSFDYTWHGYDYFENFIEDFDEFQKVKDVPSPIDSEPLRNISEFAFKTCLANILGGNVEKDWGGESSDFYTAHLHLQKRSVTGAFLLKGPAKFAPMTLNHLGKNNDQIVRLATEPAQVLFVQHCHEILPAVRQTLRAFAVQPGNPRRYCLIDGRDSLRLLYAYDLYSEGIKITKQIKNRI